MRSRFDDPRDARLRLLAQHLHDLGPRPIYHFLREVRDGKDFQRHLERYADLDPLVVRALGGNKFPAPARRRRRRGSVQ